MAERNFFLEVFFRVTRDGSNGRGTTPSLTCLESTTAIRPEKCTIASTHSQIIFGFLRSCYALGFFGEVTATLQRAFGITLCPWSVTMDCISRCALLRLS